MMLKPSQTCADIGMRIAPTDLSGNVPPCPSRAGAALLRPCRATVTAICEADQVRPTYSIVWSDGPAVAGLLSAIDVLQRERWNETECALWGSLSSRGLCVSGALPSGFERVIWWKEDEDDGGRGANHVIPASLRP